MLRGVAVATGLATGAGAVEFPVPFTTPGHPTQPAMSSAAAAAALRVPDGFKATLFAGEPGVQNPIAMAWDAAGRLWVAENYTYAERRSRFELGLRDRVLVFEDASGDGRFSSRRVFVDDVQRLTSVEIGRGGVWLMCPPQLLFVADRDQDGVADGPAEVVLDGFTIPSENYHTLANGLRFGPDGWLYGRCGASSPGEVGAPGTPADRRVPLRGTLWRYQPETKVVEVLSSGTTNPWGHDWDAHGELFFINTVNGHLWHAITGAHYERPHTIDPNPHVFELIGMHADHWHFNTAQSWTESRDGAANALGGGHAHAGVMIYQGDNWPTGYRDRLYTLNFHGRRANEEILERFGSGYRGRHGKDTFVSEDPWFRGIDLLSGPDGGVFVLDWSDTGECHNNTGVHRGSGRIHKIVYGEPARRGPADLRVLSSRELAALQAHGNVWFARQAQGQLIGRALRGEPMGEAVVVLRELFENHPEVPVRLRALWTLYSLGTTDRPFLQRQLAHANEYVRVWAVRLLTDRWPLDTVLSERPVGRAETADEAVTRDLIHLAATDNSGLVRLALASALQRLPVTGRAALAAALARRAEDAHDHNLPRLIWYGLIPMASAAPLDLARLAAEGEMPLLRRFAARRLVEDVEQDPAPVNALLTAVASSSAELQREVLQGLGEGLKGWRRATKPAAWDAFAAAVTKSGDAAMRDQLRDIEVLFGDGRALADVRRTALDAKAPVAARKAALEALLESGAPEVRQVCEQLLRVRGLNVIAARGLARFDDPAIAPKLVAAFPSFEAAQRGAVIDALVARPAFARVLLTAIGAGRIERGAITPFHARQIRNLGDEALTRLLTETWGELRESAADKAALQAKYRAELTADRLARANKSRGRAIYANLCAACHRLYGDGGTLGPDLTGAGRDNLDYLLEHIVDPSAVVTADFRIAVVKLRDGRSLNGFISARTPRTLTIRGMTETHTIERADVAALDESSQSLMPDGLLETLTPEQRLDLVAYLMHPTQVPNESANHRR
jgi:putative membrane-bound dehydrogenase-like protein